jgi:hypothetical protein
MGYSLAWTAVEQTSAAVLAQLGLAESDVRGDFYGFPLAGMTLPNGWYIVTAKACDHWIGSSRTLSKLSNACRVISCVVEEHVTYSSAAFWRDGRQKWAVRHRGGDFGIMDLVTEGSLPEDFAEIRARDSRVRLPLGMRRPRLTTFSKSLWNLLNRPSNSSMTVR